MDNTKTKMARLNTKDFMAVKYTREEYDWDEKPTVYQTFIINDGYKTVSLDEKESLKLANFIIKTLGA